MKNICQSTKQKSHEYIIELVISLHEDLGNGEVFHLRREEECVYRLDDAIVTHHVSMADQMGVIVHC